MKSAMIICLFLLALGGGLVAVSRNSGDWPWLDAERPRASHMEIFPEFSDPGGQPWSTDWSWDAEVTRDTGGAALLAKIRPWGGLSFRTSGTSRLLPPHGFLQIDIVAVSPVVDSLAVSLEDGKEHPAGGVLVGTSAARVSTDANSVMHILLPISGFGKDLKQVHKINIMSRHGQKTIEFVLRRVGFVPAGDVVDLVLAREAKPPP